MLKKCNLIMPIALILILLSSLSAQAENTLVLPAGTMEIQAQAFYGDTAIGEVKLPEGLLWIESQAFAESSVTKINLPSSLAFIAEDAFKNCNGLDHVAVQAGTYAYTRAHEIGLFDLRAVISGDIEAAIAGENIVWTAKAMNGVAPYKYLFEVYRNGEKIDSRAYTAEDSYTYQFTRAGEYYAIVKIKDDDGNVASAKSAIVTVTANAPVIESVTCDLSVIQTTEEVCWTVLVKNGTAPYTYAFALNQGDQVVAESENSTGEYSFTFEDAGDYILSVTVTDAYQESASTEIAFSVSLRPVEIENVTCSHEALEADTEISWTVNAAAGVNPYTYSYEILSGSEVIFAAADQTANTCSYTFEASGEYTLSVIVKDAEGNTATSTRALSVAPRALEIVDVDYKPNVELGNDITWTVNAVGGDKPLRYAFDLYKDGEELDGAAFGESNSFTFTPNAAGKYSVRIRVRDQQNTTVEMLSGEVTVYISTDEEYFTYSISGGKATVTGYTGTATDVYIPATLGGYRVTNIGSSAFKDCSSLTSVMIPEGVTSIGYGAFYGCRSLTSVTIPEGVTSIGDSTFYNCSSLTSVTIPEGVTSIGDYAFSGCSSLESVTIPANVTSIGTWTFYNCSSLTSVTIPEGVTSIGDYAFDNCSGLTSVTIPEGVTSIGNYAFTSCSNLTSVTLPESVTSIGTWAFYNCSSLTSVTIPGSVTSIGDFAFYNCSGLTSVTIPEGVTTIGYSAFENCSSLESVTIPDSVTSIGSCAFLSCNSLENVYAESLEGWLNIAFSFVSNPMEYADNLYIGGELLTKVVIPDSVTNIGPYVFNNCDRLTSVTIPGSVASIGEYAFNSCDNLMNVTLNEGLKTIGKYAFSNCGLLMNVTLPSGLEKVESCAFSSCYSLTNVYGPDLQDWLHIEFVDAVSNPMYFAKNLYLEGKPLAVTQVTWPEELDKIGNYTFCNWTSLESIIIPQSVTSIGDGAFDGCEKLSSLNLPDGITSIGKSAFDGCKKLTNLTLPANLTSIGSYAFSSCTSLTEITIPAGVTEIETGAFNWCNLQHIELPENITSIGDGAFTMNKMSEITIPSKVQSIGTQAFAVCEELTKVIIPESVQQIGRQAFMYCISLSEIYIPESVISIGAAAFEDCENLTVFCYEGSFAHTYCQNNNVKFTLIKE